VVCIYKNEALVEGRVWVGKNEAEARELPVIVSHEEIEASGVSTRSKEPLQGIFPSHAPYVRQQG